MSSLDITSLQPADEPLQNTLRIEVFIRDPARPCNVETIGPVQMFALPPAKPLTVRAKPSLPEVPRQAIDAASGPNN